MNRMPLSLAAFVLAIISVLVYPLSAAAQGARARGSQPVIGQAVPRGQSPRANEGQAPRQAEAQRAAPPAQRTAPPAQRTAPPAQRATPPAQSAAVAVAPPRRIEVPRATAVPRSEPRVVTPQVVVPQVIQPRVGVGRVNDHPAYRPDYRPSYRDYRQYRPDYRSSYYSGYRPTYRPYYTFRPRVRLGFGIWVGYPVVYPYYAYAYPYSPSYAYPSTYSYPYTYANPVSIYSAPGTATVAASGGLSFDIRPAEASVYIDGQYVGVVSQFAPDQPPLWLLPGRHHVEIREPGFEVVAFDVDITPGQVIPYHGDLRRF